MYMYDTTGMKNMVVAVREHELLLLEKVHLIGSENSDVF